MSTLRTALRCIFFALVFTAPLSAYAVNYDVRVFFDTDSNHATGCTIPTANGPVAGVEQVLTTSVTVNGGIGTVTGVTRQTCVNGLFFGDPVPVNGGWNVGVPSSGNLFIETHVGANVMTMTNIPTMRLAFTVTSGGLTDAMTTDFGDDILYPVRPSRRHAVSTGALRTIRLDGNDTDWAGVGTLASGDAASPALRFLDASAYADLSDLYFSFRIQTNVNAPTALDDFYALGTIGGTLSVSTLGVLNNDSDPNHLLLTAVVVEGPEHGTLTLNANGGFTYAHDGSNFFEDHFRYRITNGTLQSNLATVTISLPGSHPYTFTSADHVTFTAGQINTFHVTVTGNPTPALTEEGVLPSGITFTDNGDGTGTLSGTPAAGTVGAYPIVFHAEKNKPHQTDQNFTLTVVCSALTVTPPIVHTGTVNTPFSQTFTQSGGAAPITWSKSGALPAGLTFNTSTGVLSGTPAQGGTFPIVVTATDASGCTGNANYTLIIVCNTVTVTNPGTTTGTVNVAFSQTFTQAGGVGATAFSLASGTLPAGLALNASTGVLSGTPTQKGSFPIVVRATDSHGCSGDGATFPLNIGCQVISVTNPVTNTGTVNIAFSQTFTSGNAIAPVTFSLNSGTLPAGITLNASTGVLSGMPTQTGSFPITIKATDANGCFGIGTTYTLTIGCQVITVNNPGTNSGTVNVAFSQTFTAGNAIAPVTFSLNSGTLPAGITLSSTGVLSGTPAQTGSFSITIKATDANGCFGIGATYTLTISCQVITVNNPVTNSGTVNVAFSQTFTATNAIGATTFTTASTLPAGLTLATNGTLSGTPTQTGSFGIVVHVVDANGCSGNGTTYTLTIACQVITVNNPGTASGQTNTAFSQTFTAGNAIGATTFTTASTLPSSFTLATNGTLSGTTTQSGSFPIVVMVTDANGCTGTGATYNLVINDPPAITSGNAVTFKVGVAGTFTVTTTGFPTNASMAIGETGSLPGGVTLVNNNDGTATLAGTPNGGTGGTYPITITANNGIAPNATQSFTLTVQQAPAITSANNVTFKVGVAGTFTVTTTGFPTNASMAIGESGALPGGVSFVDNNDGTATLAGTPNALTGGVYPITITANNGVTPSASQNFTLTVQQAPAITSANNVTFTVGAAGTFTVTTTGFPTNASMIINETGSLPGGVSFTDNHDGTATLAGTPNAATGGTYPLTIGADNSVTPAASQPFTLTINQAPAITSGNSATFEVSDLGTFTVTTTGFPTGATMAIGETGALPGGVTFTDNHDGTATLAGTPNSLTGGVYPITITANNGVTPNDSQNFTLTVNESPNITSANQATFPPGVPTTFTVTTTGFPSGASMLLSETGDPLPGTVTFTDNHDGTATIAGTASGSGDVNIVITASNGITPDATQNFTIHRSQAPAITSANTTTFTVGAPGTFTVTTTGFPTGASMVINETGGLPGGVTFVDNNDGTATLSGTPNAATGGTYPITITANNGIPPNATQNFTLIVNQAPAITSANATTFTVGAAGTFNVTTSGFPTAVALSNTGALPTGVTFTDNGNGTATLAGTPAAGQGGTYPIVITGNNGVAPNTTQNFTLTVNQAPAITSANTTTFTVGAAGTFSVTTSGFPTAVALSKTGALPTGVTFTDNGNGTATLAGTPAAGQGGSYPIVITGNNGVAPNATQNFTLIVNQAPAITSAASTTFTVGAAGTFSVTTSGFPTAVALSTTGALPTGVTFTDNGNGTATLAGTPAAGQGGTYPIVITGNNGVAPNATQNFTLTVNQAPAITSANTTTFTVGAAGTFSVTTSGFPTAVALSKTGALPTGVTFTDNGNGTATLAGTPAAGQGGSYPIVITGNNGVAPNATQNFTLIVDQAPAIISGASTTFTVGAAGTFNVTTSGFPTVALSETGALPTGVTFTDNGNGTATLAGTPAALQGGTYPIVITGNNGVAPNATQNFTLTVNQAPAITSGNTATFQTGQLGTFTVTTTGFPTGASMVISKSGSLPATVTFTDNHNGTATLTGTPNATDGGSYPITITANNGVAPNATQSFTLTINQPPAITSANNTTFAPGVAGTPFTVTTTGFPTNGITRTGTLPSGVTFTDNGNNTATIAGTPAAGTQSGSPYAWVITANNGVSPNATQNFTFNVVCPTITVARTGGGSFPAATFGVLYGSGQSVTASGSAATPYTYAVTSGALPTGLSLSSAGVISNLAPTATGTFTFTITATDAGGCTGSQAFSIAVNPVVGADSYSNLVDNTQAVVTGGATASPGTPFVSLTGSVLANDLPAGGVSVTAGTSLTSAGGSVTILSDGTFIYTPKANPGAAATTTDSFTYTATSNTGATATPTSASGTVTLSLAGRVWYVKNNGGGANGQSQSPFTTLAAAAAASTANDIIFVYNGDGTNSGQNAGISLKNGQQLLGEVNGLIVNAQTLVAVGSRPTIGNSAGDGVTVAATAASLTGVFIKGFSIAGTANGINLNSSGANTLTATVDNVVITNATANNGIKIAGASTTTTTATVQNSTVSAATQNGIDAQQTSAGNLVLNINNDNVTATGTGININGAGSTSTTITNFASNNVSGNTGGTGINVASATFDAVPGTVAFDVVSGGNTVIGASGNGVGLNGLVLNTVKGDLSFTDLDIFTSNGSGLVASSAATFNSGAGTGFQIVSTGTPTIDATGGPAADLSTVTANLPFVTIKSSTSASTGVSLATVLGTFTAGVGSTITNATGIDFSITGGTATVTYDGTISDASGRPVSISGATGGTKSFTGAITNNGGTGISLTSNTGATINFSGNLTLSTGSSTAFNATGGGTVTATNTSSTAVTTTGTAVNIANTTIGAGGVKFLSVSSNGSANGIVLNTTGAGGFTVIGDGGGANNGSGGTIQATTAEGILLTSASNVSLGYMNITNPGTDGIGATGVNGLTINRCNLSDNAGNTTIDDGLSLSNTSGVLAITNTSITAARHQGITIDNNNTNMTSMTITGSSVTNTPGGDGILIQMRGTSVMTTGTIGGAGALANTISGNSATGLQVNNIDTGNITGLTILNNTISGNNGGIDLDVSPPAASLTVTVQSNTITGCHTNAFNLVTATTNTGGSMTATIRSNNIGTAGVNDSGSAIGNGIRVANGGVNTALTIDSNVIREVPNGRGIDIEAQAYSVQHNEKVKIISNTIVRPSGTNQNIGCGANVPCPQASIFILSDSNGLGGFDKVCSAISGNSAYDPTSYPAGGEAAFYFARRTSASNTLQLEGTQANAKAQILATNTVTNFTAADVIDEGTSGTVAIVAAGTCGGFPP